MLTVEQLRQRFPKDEQFTIRHYDPYDGWVDAFLPGCLHEAKNLTAEDAVRYWNQLTRNGTYKVSYSGNGYYDVFPARTRMVYTPQWLDR